MATHAKELALLSLAEAALLVRTKEVSPVELVDACLARISAVNDKLAA
jgi:aspartyl-tRNA(Asn)/glutamyl-tRNA(Gln) amidotransferase subunit A